jgi:hypothetical protein
VDLPPHSAKRLGMPSLPLYHRHFEASLGVTFKST